MQLSIRQLKVVERYYDTCSVIDQHNRCRQDDFELERMIRVQKWDKRFNIGIQGFCIVDAWKLYKSVHAEQCMFLQGDFYEALSEALIDNKYDNTATVRKYSPGSSSGEQSNSTKSASRSPCLGRTSKRRKNDGNYSNYAFQGICGSCKRHKSIEVCNVCLEQGNF